MLVVGFQMCIFGSAKIPAGSEKLEPLTRFSAKALFVREAMARQALIVACPSCHERSFLHSVALSSCMSPEFRLNLRIRDVATE